MTLTDLLSWLAFGVATVGGAVAWYKVLTIERPQARQQAAAGKRKGILEEVGYWQELVEPLRIEVAACTQKLVAQQVAFERQLNEQQLTFERQIDAVRLEAQAAIKGKDDEIRMLETQSARLLLRVVGVEQAQSTGGG